MTISYNWLSQYFTESIYINVLTDILTSTGLEVDGCERVQQVKGGLAGVVIGEVLVKNQHPDADRLSVTVVDIGRGEPLQIVCGAPNVAVGQKVAVATIGTTIYPSSGEPLTMKKSKIRGVESFGMICAEDELGLGESHAGIMVLRADALIGQEAATYFELHDDYQIEIGLTPNRADAQSHIGVAEDVAAALVARGLTKKTTSELLKYPTNGHDIFKITSPQLPINVRVMNEVACPRYMGVVISNLKIAESPAWLRERLMSVGVRPVNNVVDVTNFILHELGQPLHAFDYAAIGKHEIVVQNLPKNTNFITLDAQKRELHNEDLMICDGNNEPMCIGGVFGGAKSGVSDSTTAIFLEAAYFEPIGIRRTAGRHLLRTDAARTFEKGIDPNGVSAALQRAASLILEVAGGNIASAVHDFYPNPIVEKQILVRFSRVNQLIGNDLGIDTIKNILKALRMETIAETAENITVKVPSNKPDVTREIDIIEEILRIYGLNNLVLGTDVKSTLSTADRTESYRLRNIVADNLAAKGFNEMMGLSITQSKYFEDALPMPFQFMVFINNTANKGLDVMRPTMIFSGLEAVVRNQNRQNSDLKLFEFGKTYSMESAAENTKNTTKNTTENLEKQGMAMGASINFATKKYSERMMLSLVMTGQKDAENWHNTTKAATTFYGMKAQVEGVLHRLGIDAGNQYTAIEDNARFAYGIKIHKGQQVLAQFGLLQPRICKKMDIKQAVFYAEFEWEAILKNTKKAKTVFAPLSKFPFVRRDLTLIIDKNASYQNIEMAVKKETKKLLQTLNLFDVYENETHVGEGKKSYSISMTFQDTEKTLVDKDIDATMQRVIASLEKMGATIKGK